MASTATTSLPFSGASDRRWIVRLLPSLTDFAFLIPVVLLVWLSPDGLSTLLHDGDTGWHIRTGEWILQHAAVPHHDPFSFTRPGQTWFAWEWGWDVLFAFIHSYAGLAGVAFFNLALLCFVAALLFRSVRARCGNDVLAFFVATIGLCASVVHWLARPHLVSWLLFLVLLSVLDRAIAGQRKQLWWLPMLVLLWTNIHGSFFLALLMIVLAAIGESLYFRKGLSFSWTEAWRRSRPFWFCAVACGLTTFLNPYTWHLHAHIFEFLRDFSLLDKNQEFQSPDFHHGPAIIFGWLVMPGAAAILWCFKKRDRFGCLALIATIHFSLVSVRNIPFFVFLACPLIAGMLRDEFGPYIRTLYPGLSTQLQDLQRALMQVERIERYHFLSGLVLCYVALSLATRQPGFDVDFLPKQFPVAALSSIERVHAKRIFTGDQWGDYLLYKLYPASQVFVDGRSDFYGVTFLERCLHILNARWDWEDELNRFSVDMVVVPTDTPVATLLKDSSHWSVLFDNGSLVVFGLRRKSVQPESDAKGAEFSAVPRDGGNKLGAVRAFKYRTYSNERRCI